MPEKTLTPQEILCLPIECDYSDSKTVGQLLASVLSRAISAPHSFRATQPWGSVDWLDPIAVALAKADQIWIRTDENGNIDDFPVTKVRNILNEVTSFLFRADFSTLTEPEPVRDWFVISLGVNGHKVPYISDYQSAAHTEEEAILEAKRMSDNSAGIRWIPVHVPE
jgi:hypothetical protein